MGLLLLLSTSYWGKISVLHMNQNSNSYATPHRLIRRLVVCFLLGAGSSLMAQCVAPHYSIGKVLQESPSSLTAYVSIKLSDFTPRKLICLASVLKARYQGRARIFVAIFSNQEAAKYYVPLGVERTEQMVRWASKLHAVYDFDATEHRERLVLIPDHVAEDESNHDTTIDLLTNAVSPCHLQVKDRCLLEFHDMWYPWAGGYGTPPPTGEVVLTAVISRNGGVAQVALASASVNPPDNESVFVNLAIANLKSWRFEPGIREEPLRITYSFEVVESLPHGTEITFALPDLVTIKTGRSLQLPQRPK